jgi:glycosyltransferase involved in cell wall biosynthesis
LLAIGTDPALLGPAEEAFGDAHQRQRLYASVLDEYRMIVRTLDGETGAIDQGGGFWVHPCPTRNRATYPLGAATLGAALHTTSRFDLVSTEDPMLCGLAGYLLRRRLGIPFSAQIAGDMVDNPHWMAERPFNRALNVLAKWLLWRADSVRVVSEREREKMIRLGVEPGRVANLGWISDFDRFDGVVDPDLRREMLGDGHRVMLFVGRLVRQKGLPTLLRAFARIHAVDPGARLAIVGEGPDLFRTEHMAAELGIGPHVRFMGRADYPRVPAYFASADLVLVPSLYEGNARVLAEAGASGRAVVTTDVSGAADTVIEGVTGHIVPIGKHELIAERALSLLASPATLATMGDAARGHVRELYSAERLLPRFAEFWGRTATSR